MQHVVSSFPTSNAQLLANSFARLHKRAPAIIDFSVATLSAVLLILSFPDFNLWPLAWCALVPLLVLLATNRGRWRPFFLGWVFGTVFFYGSCYWVTYSMIHTGGISPSIAYALLVPGAVLLGIFSGLFGLILARTLRRWGTLAVWLAPVFWSALEWLRLEVTGQLWNAIGYSQAFRPSLIGPARWGGVFAVGAVIVFVNSAIAFTLLRRTKRTLWISAVAVLLVYVVTLIVNVSMPFFAGEFVTKRNTEAVVIAIQPNVPMDLVKSNDDMKLLTARHFEMTEEALKQIPNGTKPRLVIWPESPMNFGYGGDAQLRSTLAGFAQQHQVSILLNSQETAPNDGIYNSAVLINEQGKLVAQYDKIRLLPFGEYVPLPDWVPGAGLIRAIVGDFTAGTNYRLMPVGTLQAGVFICIESAYPSIARRFTNEGADVLINISNDGYLETRDATSGFTPEIRIWSVSPPPGGRTFYTKHGDVFVISCAVLSLLIFVFTFVGTAGKARQL